MIKHPDMHTVRWGKYLLFALVVFFLFFRLGAPPVFEYDEARNGINAVEMLANGHWRGLWFANAPDEWNNKPPLFIWALAGSFQVFGYNTFALRFPAALATLGSFFFIFLLCRRYYDERFAVLVVLILLSVRGIAGNHTGRTGDFDAFLIFFLMANSYFFLRYFSEEGKERDLTLASLLLAGAFLTKGPALAVLLPGQAIFLAATRKWKRLGVGIVLRQGLIFLLLPAIWLFFINDDQALLRLLGVDVAQRFTDPGFETPQSPSRFTFLFVVLDAYFNIWNYVLYLLLALALVFPQKLGFRWHWRENPLLVYALACWLSLGLGLSLAATTHRWYFSPALPFVAITLVFLLERLLRRRWQWVLVAALLCFTLGRRVWEFAYPRQTLPAIVREAGPVLEDAESLHYVGTSYPAHRDLLYLYFFDPGIRFHASLQDLPSPGPEAIVVLVRSAEDPSLLESGGWARLYEDANYVVLKKTPHR
jgi:4-amino-4-deoxy-L-arabinose transferase-like glycosyltransferase